MTGRILLILIILITAIFGFSEIETRFECPGKITHDGKVQKTTMYLKLNEYRWWVGLWSNADGNLHTEIPNVHLDYYSDITKVGDQLQIREGGQPVGNFSKLSKVIQLKTYKGFFDSKCEVIEN